MTIALCIACGELKFGAFVPCPKCGFRPNSDNDVCASLAASDHNMTIEQMKDLGERVKSGWQIKPTEEDKRRLEPVLALFRKMVGRPPVPQRTMGSPPAVRLKQTGQTYQPKNGS